jgi:hypothetical protein
MRFHTALAIKRHSPACRAAIFLVMKLDRRLDRVIRVPTRTLHEAGTNLGQ